MITCPTTKLLILSNFFRFRWVELQLATFFSPNSCLQHSKGVILKLDRLESETGVPELNEIYAEIYDMNTNPATESRAVATRVLKWMMCSQRPLEIVELAEFASLSMMETQIKKSTRSFY